MPANDERPKLRLKNGSVVDARSAYVAWQMLQAEQTTRPQIVQALLALARGDPQSIPNEVAAELHEHRSLWLEKDGALEPIVREVLVSAYRDTTEGIVIVNPFELTNRREAVVLAEIQRQDDLLVRRIFRDLGKEPPGHSR